MVNYLKLSNTIEDDFDKYLMERHPLVRGTSDYVYGKEVRRYSFDLDNLVQEEKYQLETWQIEITFEEFQILAATLPKCEVDVSKFDVESFLLPSIIDEIDRFEIKKFANELKVNSKEEILENKNKYLVYQLCDWAFIKDEINGMFCNAGNKNKITLVKYAKVLPVISNHDAEQADEDIIKLINGVDARNLTEEQTDFFNRLGYNAGTYQPITECCTNLIVEDNKMSTAKRTTLTDAYKQGIRDTIRWIRSKEFQINTNLSDVYAISETDIKTFSKENDLYD